jgi:hypothetical protein
MIALVYAPMCRNAQARMYTKLGTSAEGQMKHQASVNAGWARSALPARTGNTLSLL